MLSGREASLAGVLAARQRTQAWSRRPSCIPGRLPDPKFGIEKEGSGVWERLKGVVHPPGNMCAWTPCAAR